MPERDVEDLGSDGEEQVNERTPAHIFRHQNSNISSEGEGPIQRRSAINDGHKGGLSLSQSLRRRYLLVLGLVIVGVMLGIVVIGVLGAMSGGSEEVASTEEPSSTDFVPLKIDTSGEPGSTLITESRPHEESTEPSPEHQHEHGQSTQIDAQHTTIAE